MPEQRRSSVEQIVGSGVEADQSFSGAPTMLIRAGYEISYDCPNPTPMTLLLSIRPERMIDLVTVQRVTSFPQVEMRGPDGSGHSR
jgi:hypothetical protein